MQEIERLVDELIVQSYMMGITAGDKDDKTHKDCRQSTQTYKMFIMAIIKEMQK